MTYRSRLPWSFYVFVVFIAGIALFAWRQNRGGAIQAIVIAVVLVIIALVVQTVGASGVEVDDAGFTVKNTGRRERYAWETTTAFATLDSGFGLTRATIVTFDTIPPKQTHMAGVTRIMTGGHGLALPRNLNVSAAVLVERMNQARAAAISRVPADR